MKSKVFCDIRGTFTGGINRKEAITDIINCLNCLDESEEISFSFISSDNMEYVSSFAFELSKYILDSKIKLGTQYSSDIAFDGEKCYKVANNKIDQMMIELEKDDYDIIYYFEDNYFNVKLFNMILPKKYPNSKVVGFLIKNSEQIDGMVDTLYSYKKKGKAK